MILDRRKSVGSTLFDNNRISLQPDLLIGLVQALMLLGEELGPTKGALREAELGKYQIGILSRDHLAYVVVQDSYDSEPFTKKILEQVIEEFHSTFMTTNFNHAINNGTAIRKRVKELLKTMKFPRELLPNVKNMVNEFQLITSSICDTLMLADLDDGIIEIFEQPNNDTIIKILMEILSEIPFERHWIGESKLINPVVYDNISRNYEAWVIYRIGFTDYCLMGRAYYNPDTQRELIVKKLEELTENILQLLLEHNHIN